MINKFISIPISMFVLAGLLVLKNQQVAIGQSVPPPEPISDVFSSDNATPDTNNFSPVNANRPELNNNFSATDYGDRIVYQVIEKAVPGPQGPIGQTGPQGPAGQNGSNSTIASFFPNTSMGSQYIGYGAGVNPIGDGNLSSLNVTGLSTLSTLTGVGLSSCNTLTSKLMYNSTNKVFECGTESGGAGGFSGGDLSAQNVFATSTLQTPIVYASTTNASTTNTINLFVSNASLTFATSSYFSSYFATITNATISQATSTSIFSSILTAITTTFTNLIFTNATGTNATTTNFYTNNLSSDGNFKLANGNIASTTIAQAIINNYLATLATITSGTSTNWYSENSSSTNSNTTNLLARNATFSYATVTNGFFTNLSVTGPVEAALNNGYIFRGNSSNISEATSTIFVADTGKIGIGSTTPSEKLSVQGNLLVSGNIINPKLLSTITSNAGDKLLCLDGSNNVTIDNFGSCYGDYSSDIRLKTNIATVTSTLEKVKALTTVNFNWIDSNRGTTTQLGYIAQDVEKVFPEVIRKDSEGYLKVNYISLSAIYANAIKELDEKVFAKIGELFNKLTGVEQKQQELENRIKVLEEKLNVQIPTPIPIPIPIPTPTPTPTPAPTTVEGDDSQTDSSTDSPTDSPTSNSTTNDTPVSDNNQNPTSETPATN